MEQQQPTPTSKSIAADIHFQEATSGAPSNAGTSLEKKLLQRLLHAFGNPAIQLVLWDGQEVSGHADKCTVRIVVRDRIALWKLLYDPDLYFGELYAEQGIEVQGSLLELLEAIGRGHRPDYQNTLIKKLWARLHDAQRNTLDGSRRNIYHHYDIGNDFYRLWLDEQMLYTCAYFPDPSTTLEAAQKIKMDHICRKLQLQPGQKVIEAGCGWGALALHMARHYGVTVKAYNISREQIAFARQRAQDEGLQDQVEFVEDDYRNVSGMFDAFVSVGMLEHVGTDHYEALGKVINRSLTAQGRGLIHTIGLNYPHEMNPWLTRHIFPGANPPSLAQMMQIFEPHDFSVLDVENLRLHYALTLQHWLQRFEDKVDQVTAMYSPEFVRTWRVYLSGSLTAFKIGTMQLFQVSFSRADNNQIPWTRQYLYESANQGASHGKL